MRKQGRTAEQDFKTPLGKFRITFPVTCVCRNMEEDARVFELCRRPT